MGIKEFFLDVDRHWKPLGPEPIVLRVIGSAALMLQVDYERGTKDSDVLETEAITPAVRKALLDLAGRGSELFQRHRMYLDIVSSALPFLPQRRAFHPVAVLSSAKSFKVEALDVADVVLSKLMRFNANDVSDIREMVRLGKVEHAKLIDNFKRTLDWFSLDARADDLPRCLRNLHAVEREHFGVAETEIELPD